MNISKNNTILEKALANIPKSFRSRIIKSYLVLKNVLPRPIMILHGIPQD